MKSDQHFPTPQTAPIAMSSGSSVIGTGTSTTSWKIKPLVVLTSLKDLKEHWTSIGWWLGVIQWSNEVGLETPKNMRPPAQKMWTVPLSGCNLDSMEDSVPGPTDNHYQGVLNVLVGDAFLFYDLGCWVRAHVVSSTCMAWIETIETKF